MFNKCIFNSYWYLRQFELISLDKIEPNYLRTAPYLEHMEYNISEKIFKYIILRYFVISQHHLFMFLLIVNRTKKS